MTLTDRTDRSRRRSTIACTIVLLVSLGAAWPSSANEPAALPRAPLTIELGPRPRQLAASLPEGELRDALLSCDITDIEPSPFSIGHRGAPFRFAEHTRESYIAAARMGAGIVECDVAFTKDLEPVCRHSQCDLHTTTDILASDLAARCAIPPDLDAAMPFRDVRCCTSDLTLAEFRTLDGRRDASDPSASTVEAYLDATPAIGGPGLAAGGTLMTHAESIALFDALGVDMTPELKEELMPLIDENGRRFSRAMQADRLLQDYRDAGIDPSRVWPQSFEAEDIAHWIRTAPAFAAQLVQLDDRYRDDGFDPMRPSSWTPSMSELYDSGLRWLAPPLWMLVTAERGRIVPSAYATAARAAGLGLIAWTLERSGSLSGGGGWYYRSIAELTDDDAVALQLLDVLARDVGVAGVFSDWPATTSFYAHCRLH